LVIDATLEDGRTAIGGIFSLKMTESFDLTCLEAGEFLPPICKNCPTNRLGSFLVDIGSCDIKLV